MRTDDQKDFDKLLTDSLPELPPEDIAHDVSPWRVHMRKVIAGLALSLVTLNFWNLNYFLPFLGALLLFLGFRALRKTDGAFAIGTLASLLNLLLSGSIIILEATLLDYPTGVFAAVGVGLKLLIVTSLAFALGKIIASGSKAFLLLLWYAVICVLAIFNYSGIIVPILLILLCILILRRLWKISCELEDNGYSITPTAPRLSDRAVAIISVAVCLIGVAAGLLFFNKYPMRWQKSESGTSPVRERLVSLGFPEDVLADLTDAEIADCENARRVVVQRKDHPLNNGRLVTKREGSTTNYSREYDVNELHLTMVAVEVDDFEWRVIHHFSFDPKPNFLGTESLKFWRGPQTFTLVSHTCSGRLLCEKNGETLTADYHFLGIRSYETASTLFWGRTYQQDLFAEFSFDNSSVNPRGYVTFKMYGTGRESFIDSWVDFTHQKLPTYPAQSAGEFRRTNLFSNSFFVTVQDALQFVTDEE